MTRSLEEHIAHLSRVVEDLSDVVARQDAEIAKLKTALHALLEREKAREADGSVIFTDDRPPHY